MTELTLAPEGDGRWCDSAMQRERDSSNHTRSTRVAVGPRGAALDEVVISPVTARARGGSRGLGRSLDLVTNGVARAQARRQRWESKSP